MRNKRYLAALVLLSACLSPAGAPAQNATWLASPGSGNFNTGANWSTGTVPTGTASFGASNTTNLTIGQATTIGGWTFNPGAPAYGVYRR